MVASEDANGPSTVGTRHADILRKVGWRRSWGLGVVRMLGVGFVISVGVHRTCA